MATSPLDTEFTNPTAEGAGDEANVSSTDISDEWVTDSSKPNSASASIATVLPRGVRDERQLAGSESSRLTQTEGQLSVDGQVDKFGSDVSLKRPLDHRLEHNDGDVFDETNLDRPGENFVANDNDERLVSSTDQPDGIATAPDHSTRQTVQLDWGDRFGALFHAQATSEFNAPLNEMSPATVIPYERIESGSGMDPIAEETLVLESLMQGDATVESLQTTGESLFRAAERSLRADGRSVQLELHPPELGMLKVNVTQVDQRIETHIIATELVTSELLNLHRDQLLQTLSDLGFDSSEVDISHEQHAGEHERFGGDQKSKDNPMTSARSRTDFAEPKPNPAVSNAKSGLNIVA